jgi:hypothetical protein
MRRFAKSPTSPPKLLITAPNQGFEGRFGSVRLDSSEFDSIRPAMHHFMH